MRARRADTGSLRLDSYPAHRQRLLAETFPIAALVAFAVTLLYTVVDFFGNPRFLQDLPRVLIELTLPIAALLLARGALRRHVWAVALAFDLAYTAFMATGMLMPANTVSGTAVFLSLKMVGTALLFRWDPRIQCISSAFTSILFFGLLALAPELSGSRLVAHQIVAPLIGALFSVIGAYSIDRTHRQLFQHGARLAESEAQLRDTLVAERDLLEQVREADRVQNELVANMSHELRTPLNIIVGYTDVLLSDPRLQDDEQSQSFLERIAASTRALYRLLESLLEYARLHRARSPVLRRTFSADTLLGELRALGEDINCGATIHVADAPGLSLCSDYARLYSVLSNLLLNAMKFTPNGFVEVTAHRNDASVEFRVRDTGVGISPEQVERIFEPFQQGDGSMTRQFGGVGLGLAIVVRNVDLLGGTVRVDSQPGRGSTFTVSVPVGTEDTAQPPAEQATPSAPPPP